MAVTQSLNTAPESRAPSGDHARRRPFCSLWTLRRTLRREPGPQRRPRAPGPQRPRAPQALLSLWTLRQRAGPPAATTRAASPSAVSGHCAGHCGESRTAGPSAVSGHCAREPGPQRRPRAPQALLQSLDTAPATAERAGPAAATTHAGGPSAVSGTLRREPGPQRRPRAPEALLQSLNTAPDTAERAGPPAATTRAAGPSAVSGHCGESRSE